MFLKKKKTKKEILKAYRKAEKRAFVKAAMVYPIEDCKAIDDDRLKEQFAYQLKLEKKYKMKVLKKFDVSEQELVILTKDL